MRRRDLLHQLGLSVPGGIVAGAQFLEARPQNARLVQSQKAKEDASTIAPEKGTGRTATRRPRVQGRYVNRPLVQVDVKALRLLDDMEERAAKYFFEQADPTTGSVYDRARADGMGPTEGGITHAYRSASSISATGLSWFGRNGVRPRRLAKAAGVWYVAIRCNASPSNGRCCRSSRHKSSRRSPAWPRIPAANRPASWR